MYMVRCTYKKFAQPVVTDAMEISAPSKQAAIQQAVSILRKVHGRDVAIIEVTPL